MKTYDHAKIEKKWKKEWEKEDLYKVSDEKEGAENFFLLVEYPYPSGNLHVGHWYAFAVPDIFARKKRMEGYNVLFPIGFDSFGLPAENAAIKHKVDPREWTEGNIARMTEQLKSMGNSFDWSRVVAASDPSYYKWTQWLFLQLYKKGLAYRGQAPVNWCPSCKTVLANEQVTSDACERCGTAVEERELEQWFLRITDYADRLLAGLDDLDWPQEIKEAQRNWIGKSEGAEISFVIKCGDGEYTANVFTTRPDTLFGATYLVLAPEHPLVSDLVTRASNRDEIEEYARSAGEKSREDRFGSNEKTGVEVKGVRVVNPGSGEDMSLWIADYVLGSYGTGAVMGVPAHDERDFEFAKKFNIPVKCVIDPIDQKTGQCLAGSDSGDSRDIVEAIRKGKRCYGGAGKLMGSGKFDGTWSEDAKKTIVDAVGGKPASQYRLRDWLISRQRYWGAPIPIVYDPEGNAHAVPNEHLPWLLPDDVDFTPTGEAPLARSEELKARTERIFGKGWRPEVDTMDTFVDSSWYFLRYLDPNNAEEFSPKEKQELWMPVDRYSGGAEHTTMHVLYSRFLYKALHDLGLVTHEEPYIKRMNRGLVLGPDGQKMSKSKGNVIDPDENVRKFGADTVKMYLSFIGPYNEVGTYPWDMGGIAGIRRFLERAWFLKDSLADEDVSSLTQVLARTAKKVGEDVEQFKFNTAVSALMIFVNEAISAGSIGRGQYEIFVKLLAPFAPFVAEELWRGVLGNKGSVHREPWPVFGEELGHEATFMLIIQVDGKVRDSVEMPLGTTEDEARSTALGRERIKTILKGAEPKKVIYVPGRIINIVT